MIYARVFLVLFWVGWGSTFYSQAAAAGQGVHVVMYELPETLWQAEFEGRFLEPAALQKRLEEEFTQGRVKKPVSSLVSTAAGVAVETKGEEPTFVTGWETREKGRAIPTDTTTRFVGTLIVVEDKGITDRDPGQVTMKMEHHFAPPTMYKINYANAATGAERDKLSVEYPQFDKLEWQGQLSVGPRWRQVASVLRPASEKPGVAPAMRYLIFIKRA